MEMKRFASLAGVPALIALTGSAFSAEIDWTVRPNTCSDSDVRVDGRCLYAYTPAISEVNVNGVQFSRWTIPNDVADTTVYSTADFADDASFDTPISCHRGVNWLGDVQTAAWTGGDGYRTLLQRAWYAGEKQRTLVLKGLVAGKRYLVQIWMCDARSTLNTIKKLTLGDAVGDCYSNGFGCNFTGTFTADGETQQISFVWTSEPNFTAFQVRCLDEARITWTGAYTSGEDDVRTDGDLAYAYKGGETLEAGGTIFCGWTSDAGYFGRGDSPDVTFSPALGTLHPGSFCESSASVPYGAFSYSEAYRSLIGKGYYGTWNRGWLRRNVTLRNLRPGLRYLVQIWTCDNRHYTYANRTVVVDGGVVLAHNSGATCGHGSTAVGVFTATATEQTFSCYHRCAEEKMVAVQDMIGPVQVRCLDADYEGWIVGDTKQDGSVDTRGRPLYAYSGTRTEVAGTAFEAFAGMDAVRGDVAARTNGALFAQSITAEGAHPFISEAAVEVSPAVTNLLGGGFYNAVNTYQTIELRRLVPGRRYLVQAWFMDTRKTRRGVFAGLPIQFRIAAGDRVAETGGDYTYQYDKAPLGQYVTGVFRATGDTFSMPFEMYWGQLNAIQLRVLDQFGSDIVWVCAETAPGYGSVSTEGTAHCAYAPVAFDANGVSFAAGATGAADIGGDGNVVLRREFLQSHSGYTEDGDDLPLFRNGWFNYRGTADGGTGDGTNTVTLGNLKRGYRYLVQLFVADLRNNSALNSRTMTISGRTGNYGPTNGKFNCGTVFTGRFTADSGVKSFEMSTASSGTAQLNAIQVRELGPAAGMAFRDGSAAAWTTDGAGWLVDGEEQAGMALWNAANGRALSAVTGENAALALGSDVTVGSIIGGGEISIGEAGTPHGISVVGEVVAPSAIVNAGWKDSDVRKTHDGVTILAGDCPALRFVTVSAGRLVLDGQCPNALDISVHAPGELGFSAVREIGIASLAGDGLLSGPGGIRLSSGDAFAVPSGIRYADGFCWSLENGSTLVLPDGFDASSLTVRIDSPKEYDGLPVVTCAGNVHGRPTFIYGVSGWRAAWSDDASGWTIGGAGLIVEIR